MTPKPFLRCWLWFLIGLKSVPIAFASVRCFSIFDCEQQISKVSECVDGYCTNPYHVGGCLANRLENHYKIRTCNSDDPPSSVEKGYCRPSTLGYMEVRVASQNWESAFFVAWVLQIVLSELLDVPVSIETGKADAKVDFYDINTSFEYGAGNDWDAVRRATAVKDCRLLKDSKEYLSCSHVVPESWPGHAPTLNKLAAEDVIESTSGLGALAEQMWYMRRNTAMRNPSLLSYFGLQGEKNRQVVAEVFKRPTTWDDYCTYVSEDQCATPDNYTSSAPSEGDGGKYYVEGSYRGYFRATELNNCTSNPACTGHIADYPCGWASYVTQQAHYLDIPVESNGNEPSGGYSYSEMVQIWNAANETDSDVLMLWWKPESLYHEYLGTDSEFQSVALPPPTQDCVDHRIDFVERCGDDPKLKIGDPRGACGEGPQSLLKVISTALFDISVRSDLPEALQSPAYETIKNYRLSELQIGKIFEYWFQRNLDKYGLDPRDATCQWVVENLDFLRPMIPRSHPRIVVDSDDVYKEPVFYAAIVFACLAIFATFCAGIVVVVLRNAPAIRYAQIEFLFLLLIGLLLVSIGSLLTALTPSDQSCVAIIWLVNFGYTLELVPLIIKVAAINQMMVASQQMRRVKLSMASLFGAVAFFCLIVCICLTVWTVMDPPRKDEDLELTDQKSEDNETIITRVFYCSSDNEAWNFLGVSWQALLLLFASIMAFQTRKVREDINETKTLAVMIYSQTVLVILRAITYVLAESLGRADVSAARSLIFSIDALTTLIIYFAPKFIYKEGSANSQNWSSGNGSGGGRDQEQPKRLNVHRWQSRNPPGHRSTAQASGSAKNEEPENRDQNSEVPQDESWLSSVRQSSIDYKTQAEWEASDDDVLDVVSEENESAAEFIDDEDEGTGLATETSP
ncbi:hypothetical protein ACA910_002611 [Epithemia clementina (nom. ined.)]